MMHDVVVVGGGPAGASTAFQLARKGVRVHILERSRFPRDKACAECLSPQASRLLHDMGALSQLEPLGAHLRGMVVRAPDGTIARGNYAGAHGLRGFRDTGLAIRRELLDDALLASARFAGATVEHGVRATGVLQRADGSVRGVQALDSTGTMRVIEARIVIAADGLRSVIARRLGLSRARRWPRRLALVSHYRDVDGVGTHGEMHVEADGFVGIADVGAGVTTVAAVFPAERAPEISGNRGGFLHRWLRSKPQLATRFRTATPIHEAYATGPFASRARRAWHPGALLVGDAADFFDPFTGEGIYAALRGGELVADSATVYLESSPRAGLDSLRDYDRVRQAEFAGKWWVERLIGASVAWAPVVNRAARRLAARPELADLLVGVTGDFVPPRRVLSASYLSRLFLAPVTSGPHVAWQ